MRSVFVDDSQGVSHRARSAVPLHRNLARADAVFHCRGSLAFARSVRGIGSPRNVPEVPRHGVTTGLRRNGASSAIFVASLPARWRSNAPISGSAPRSKPRRSSTSAIPNYSPRWSTSILPKCASPPARRWSKATGQRKRSASRTWPLSRWCRAVPRAECARSWKISAAVGLDPEYPDVTPRDAKAFRESQEMPNAAE